MKVQGAGVGGGVCLGFDGLEEEVAYAAGFEGAGGLEVFEFEEDAAGRGC